MIHLATTDTALAAALREGVEIEVRDQRHVIVEVTQRGDGATVARLRGPRDQPDVIPSGPVRIRALEDIADDAYMEAGQSGRPVKRRFSLAAGEEATMPGRFAQLLVSAGNAEIV